MDPARLDARQIDALREIANIGAGHAATALSQLTGRVIMIEVPEVRLLPLEDVDSVQGDPGQVVAAVLMKVLGDIAGRTVLMLPDATAVRLASILTGGPDAHFPHDFPETQQSALKEVGNIIVGAYLNALSDFMGKMLIMSVPSFTIDMAGAITTTSYLNFGDARDYVLSVNTRMLLGQERLLAQFLLIPDPASLQVILREMRLLA